MALWLCLLYAVSACSIPTQIAEIRGSGVVVSETRQVGDFNAINLSGIGSLTIIQGQQELLIVEAENNLLDHIESTIRGTSLTLGIEKGYTLIPVEDIKYTLTVKNLQELEVSGLGYIFCEQLIADKLAVIALGSSQLVFNDLNTKYISVEIDGAGIMKVKGKTDFQEIIVSGAGVYDAGYLRSDKAKIDISGAGSATLWVDSALEAKLSGATSLRYYGKPTLEKHVSGISRIDDLGIHP